MRLLIIGLGSMGKRRLRLLKHHFAQVEVGGVDAMQVRRDAVDIPTWADLETAADAFLPDIALICTSPLSHAGLIKTCLQRGMHVFTEINLVSDGYADNMALASDKGLTLFLSSTFLYRNEVKVIRKAIEDSHQPLLYTYHVGQYLPDWHPWEDYKDYFIGAKRTNGCREILAINLPWLVKTFGDIEAVHTVRRKLTKLEVDYPDTYLMTLCHKGGHIGVFTVDLVAREAVCALRVEGEDLLLTWNGKPDGLRTFDPATKAWQSVAAYETVDKLSGYSANIIENAYQAELTAFFDEIAGKAAAPYGFAQDAEVLRRIDEMEEVKE